MKWRDAVLPTVLTLLTVVICVASFRHAFPLEVMTRAEKEEACWKLQFTLALHVESKAERRAAMNSDYARKVCETVDLTDSPVTR